MQRRTSSPSSDDEGDLDDIMRKRKKRRLTPSLRWKPRKDLTKGVRSSSSSEMESISSNKKPRLERVEDENVIKVKRTESQTGSKEKLNIERLPDEILLNIFRSLSLGQLANVVNDVCVRWRGVARDWTLWKRVRAVKIRSMTMSTSKVLSLLKTLPHLKRLELVSRTDTEDLLDQVQDSNVQLEVLCLHRCRSAALHMRSLSQMFSSLLDNCPKLKVINFTCTYFHSKSFYKRLARSFHKLHRINVSCTTKSEMNVFVEYLSKTAPDLTFHRVPMMGHAAGRQIYWGPVLGLLIRPDGVPGFGLLNAAQFNHQ